MRLRDKLARGDFVITVEVDPPAGPDPNGLVDRLRALAGLADAVNLTDGAMANLRLSPVALAHLVAEAGLEPICHVTCRDRNLLALHAELLGAHALGVRNILALGGDPPSVFTRNPRPQLQGVYHVDLLALLRLVNGLNAGTDYWGQPLDGATHFFIAAAANPGAPDLDVELSKLRAKVEAGARFFQTQPVFDLDAWERFDDRVRAEGIDAPVLYGIWPLRSYKQARFLHDNVPGIRIPERYLRRMADAEARGLTGKDLAAVGLDIAREIAAVVARRAAGIHIYPTNRVGVAAALASAIREEARVA